MKTVFPALPSTKYINKKSEMRFRSLLTRNLSRFVKSQPLFTAKTTLTIRDWPIKEDFRLKALLNCNLIMM